MKLVVRLATFNSDPNPGNEAQAKSPRDLQIGPAGQHLEQKTGLIIHQIDQFATRW